ncbi:MAG: class I SAM-dependent methyltransferase [Gemmataceae bacterium]
MVDASNKLRLVLADEGGPAFDPALMGESVAERLYRRESFRAPSRRRREPLEPYSCAWFEQIERHRYGRHGAWIPRTLEFTRHRGETILGLGEGLGTDWLQYAKCGASVIACSPSEEQLGLVKRHFELRDMPGRFYHAPPHALPIEAASVDVVCLEGLLHEIDDPAAVIAEVYRVLRPGGKVIALAPAHYDAAFWSRIAYPWMRLLDRTSESPARAATARQLRRDFVQFRDHKVSKRHLRRAVLPQLWRLLPLALLERLIGQVLILKAFKPLSAALSKPIAIAA